MGLVRALVICAVLGLTTGKVHGSVSSVTLVKAVGDDVVFNISQDSAPYTELSWIFKNNVTIISVSGGVNLTDPGYVDRISLLADGSLELRNLTVNDWGDYTVNITSTGAPEFNQTFALRVLEPVSDMIFTASATDLIEGDLVTFFCSASGTYLNMAFYRKDHVVSMLSLQANWYVHRHDTGPFVCEAFNEINKVVREISLNISYGPDVTLKAVPSQSSYTEGSTVTLNCTVDSKPEAEITWTQDETLLPFNGTELVLKDLQYSQRGRYRCTAYNPTTNISRSASRDISVEPPQPTPTPTPSWGPSLKSFNMCSCCFWICCWIGLFLS